jgi:hypothetical protein
MSDLSKDQLNLLRSLDADLGLDFSDFVEHKKPADIVLPTLTEEEPRPAPEQQHYQQVHRIAPNNRQHDVCSVIELSAHR